MEPSVRTRAKIQTLRFATQEPGEVDAIVAQRESDLLSDLCDAVISLGERVKKMEVMRCSSWGETMGDCSEVASQSVATPRRRRTAS